MVRMHCCLGLDGKEELYRSKYFRALMVTLDTSNPDPARLG